MLSMICSQQGVLGQPCVINTTLTFVANSRQVERQVSDVVGDMIWGAWSVQRQQRLKEPLTDGD